MREYQITFCLLIIYVVSLSCHQDVKKILISETEIVSTEYIQIPWLLVRKRAITTELPPLVVAVSANCCEYGTVAWSAQQIPMAVNLGVLDRSHYFSIK
jgi:hypothetical protein